ncbi:hypothetical protein [Sphingopyxis chilensis]
MIDFFMWEYPSQIWTDRPAQELIDPEHCQSRAELPTRQIACNRPFEDSRRVSPQSADDSNARRGNCGVTLG